MEQQSSTSTVTVEYFDPHDVYKLLAPGLIPRLPLHNLHWQSHSGPLRSIDTLHVELVQGGDHASGSSWPDNGFQTQHVGGSREAAESTTSLSLKAPGSQRRHQIPGIRRTPYLKLLLVRCDDNESYKSSIRAEIRDWVKTHTGLSGSSKKASGQENHDAFEWLIVHVVLPNTVASTQPRTSSNSGTSGGGGGSHGHSKSDGPGLDKTSRWRTGSTPLMEKLRVDFNGSAKGSLDRIAQIRIGINDVPYSLLPRVVPAVPSGYLENDQDAENAWSELMAKLKSLILSSFDMRVTQYEEDIREKDGQRSLPGWNFCTFFMLKEGLARGFENVGLVEDALVGYDELSVGLDAVIHEQLATGSPEAHGGAMLSHTPELKLAIEACLDGGGREMVEGKTAVDAQSRQAAPSQLVEIAISSTKKAYRDMIMENKVSVFDFRCYIFSRQIALLLRLGNAPSSREELLTKLRRQQESILTGEAPLAPPPSHKDEPENLAVFAEICQRTLHFIPSVSQTLRSDLISALLDDAAATKTKGSGLSPAMEDAVENMVASFAFSVAQQILAQTSSKALPIPPTSLTLGDGQEPKALIPEPKTMLHPARSSSLSVRTRAARPPPSPGVFPGPGRQMLPSEGNSHFMKPGLEDLAARRAELYMVSRTILTILGKKRGWSNGWDEAPVIGDDSAVDDVDEMEDVDLNGGQAVDKGAENGPDEERGPDAENGSDEKGPNDENGPDDENADEENGPEKKNRPEEENGSNDESADEENGPDKRNENGLGEDVTESKTEYSPSISGIDSQILQTATDSVQDFYRLYEILTDEAMRHYTLAGHDHAVHSNIADLAVLKFHVKDFKTAASYFCLTAPFFGESGWVSLELSMLAMYAQCLDEMQSKVDYVNVALKLLTKACAVEREQAREKKRHSWITSTHHKEKREPDGSWLKGVIEKLTRLAKTLSSEVQVPLTNFFADVELAGPPEYHDKQDGCALHVKMRSLLPEAMVFDSMKLRIVSVDGAGNERIFEHTEGKGISIMPGQNTIQLECNSVVAGRYKVDYLGLSSSQMLLHSSRTSEVFKHSDVMLFQRSSVLDVTLTASRHTALDKSNSLELGISTGWNSIRSCEVRVKPATGGLRFSTNQATIVGSSPALARPPEAGVLTFGPMAAGTKVALQFPYSVEQDVSDVSAKVEATYVTETGETYSVAKSLSVAVSLALGVNVQDVFKHSALLSRFNVSTAGSSPLRLLRSELLGSELFESASGVCPATVTIFPKQPASLLYRVKRRSDPSSSSAKAAAKTMYLKLHYAVLESEVEASITNSLLSALQTAGLGEYGRLVTSCVLAESRNRIQPRDLERAALTGEVTTSHLREVAWGHHFDGLGRTGDSKALCAFLETWLRGNTRIRVVPTQTDEASSILIPVDIPSVSIVHTADIRLHSTAVTTGMMNYDTPVVCTNEVVPASLHLKWTRIWRTEPAPARDQEFRFEVSAPADTWLLGGRRRGHFTVPAGVEAGGEGVVALVLVPLREGYLPYPTVEVREVVAGGEETVGAQGSEMDLRNLGEVVRVVAGRAGVTVSLDASGPGGGPLVFESEGIAGFGGRVLGG